MAKIGQKLGFCAVFFAFLLLLGGCENKSKVVNFEENKEGTVSITFFGNKYEAENVIVIEKIISGFMEENPNIKVSYESLKGKDYFDALKKRMAVGKGNDVFMVNHDVVLEFENEGKLADLSGLSTIKNYTDEMLEQMTDNGKVYWVPTTISAFGLYCNVDILKEHKRQIPENLEDWEKTCDYFVGKGITPIVANNDISLKTLAIGKGFYPLYKKHNQIEAFDGLNRGESQLSTYLQPGFEMVKDFVDKGYIDADSALVTEKTSDDLEKFAEGKTPFMLTGAWAAGRLKEMNSDLAFQVVPYPIVDDGTMAVINADTRLSVNAYTDNPKAVMEFVEYFTRQDNIQQFADQQCSFSPLTGGSISSVEEIQPLVSCYQSGKTVIGADGHLNLPIWEVTAQASQKILSGESVKEVMAWMDQEIAENGGKR